MEAGPRTPSGALRTEPSSAKGRAHSCSRVARCRAVLIRSSKPVAADSRATGSWSGAAPQEGRGREGGTVSDSASVGTARTSPRSRGPGTVRSGHHAHEQGGPAVGRMTGGDPSLLRRINSAVVLHALRGTECATLTEITRVTGLSRPTVEGSWRGRSRQVWSWRWRPRRAPHGVRDGPRGGSGSGRRRATCWGWRSVRTACRRSSPTSTAAFSAPPRSPSSPPPPPTSGWSGCGPPSRTCCAGRACRGRRSGRSAWAVRASWRPTGRSGWARRCPSGRDWSSGSGCAGRSAARCWSRTTPTRRPWRSTGRARRPVRTTWST